MTEMAEHQPLVDAIADACGSLAGNATNSTASCSELQQEMNWNLNTVQWLHLASGIATLAAAAWSLKTMDKHIRYNKHGIMRAYVVRILFMVPIYACASWLGLIQESFSLWWNLVREVYEAFTIYSFIWFLMEYLGGEHDVRQLVQKRYAAGRRLIHHMWPCNKCWRTPANPKNFVLHVKIGVMQYVVVQVVCALLMAYLQAIGRYREGEWSLENGYPYFVVLRNCSQTWALYDLVWFYHSMAAELAGSNPLPKAMCIKGVVFFTYWQSLLFSVLGGFGLLTALERFVEEPEAVAASLQNFIICLEMFVAAALHAIYFPYDEFNALPPRDTSLHLDLEEIAPPTAHVPEFDAVRDSLVAASLKAAESESPPSPRSDRGGSPFDPAASPVVSMAMSPEQDERREAKQALSTSSWPPQPHQGDG